MIRTYNCPYCYSSNIEAMCVVDGFTTFRCKNTNCLKTFNKNTGKNTNITSKATFQKTNKRILVKPKYTNKGDKDPKC